MLGIIGEEPMVGNIEEEPMVGNIEDEARAGEEVSTIGLIGGEMGVGSKDSKSVEGGSREADNIVGVGVGSVGVGER